MGESTGGVAALQKRNEEKRHCSMIFWTVLPVQRHCAEKDRSLMNVVPFVPTEELNAKFIKEAGEKPCEPERPSYRWRHACQHLQRYAQRRRRSAGGVYETV